MNHTEHDHELIAGHATGLETDRAQAESLLASCPSCAADYREQLSVKEVLGTVPEARLTEIEAVGLTQVVMGQLPAQVIESVVDIATVRVPKPLSPLWGRMTAVAAVLAGVVAVGTLITSGGGGSGSAATTTGAFERQSAEGTSDALIASTATAGATTAAAGETADVPGETTVAGDTAGEGESIDAVAAEAARLLSEVDEDSSQTTSAATATTLAFAETCPDLSELTVLASAEVSLDDRPVVILVVERGNGLVARAFYTDDCTEVDLSPRS